MTEDRPYTVAETAAKLGVTEQRVRQMCKKGELSGAEKKDERWIIPGRSVRERFAVKPPMPKRDEEVALAQSRRTILDLAGRNAHLRELLDDSRKSEARALQELEDAKQELAAYKHYLRTEKAQSERLRQGLAEQQDLTAKLRQQIETAERNSKMGANRPRLIRDSDRDPGPEDRRRRR